ncbi:cytochrome ubiquinol oxidase subunit I [Alkalicoccobacillus porphyridii]|uniref:Cytochrome ubiquinol oxidase subunit I n=1 Tax=Alkalicoccobacillus porphyridii TaxID=2597270 RepID=A0A553ZUP5_9BACI|nr:cytochrome ubiquinol oxidase subunit I [Alkalicoccobacillus porphyridii]TSB45218.1 cytochrome ubiquinol oxidase subunit I [Alkalicoccobacillus porphyridii]
MDSVLLSRMLFGSSMAFHIIFATLTVGITLMILLAEIMRLIKKDNDYTLLAKRWTKGAAVLLGVAIPSGTIVAIMLSLLWPQFMKIVGEVIALPFQIEIFAFFLEALFLSIYVYAADRLGPVTRLIAVFFVAFGAAASAILITNAHAWMNTPRGFELVDGQVVNVDPLAAIQAPSFFVTAQHVVGTAFMAGAFVLASVAAYKLLQNHLTQRETTYHQKGLVLSLIVALIMSSFTALSGHETAVMLYEELPIKLAASEGLFETTDNAALTIFGTPSVETESVIGGIEIPGLLSWIATGSTDGVIQGLNDFPQDEWPPLFIHTLFNVMVGIGFILLGLAAIGCLLWFIRRKHTELRFPKWLLASLVASGPLAIIGIETGWIYSCTGRQPWTIYGIQRTADAATNSGNLGILFFLFSVLYIFLLVLTGLVMYFYFKRNPVSDEFTTQNETLQS